MPTAYLSPSLLQDLTNVSANPGAGNTGYPLVWNNATGRFELAVLGVAGGGTGTSNGTLLAGLISASYQDVGNESGSFVDLSSFQERLYLADLLYSVTSSGFIEPVSNLFDRRGESFCTVANGQTFAEVLINFTGGNHALTAGSAFSYSAGRLAINHYPGRRNGTYSVWLTVRADINGLATTETINDPIYGAIPFSEVFLGEFTPIATSAPSATFISMGDYSGVAKIRIRFNRPRPNNTDPLLSIAELRYFPTRGNPGGEYYAVQLFPNSVKTNVFGTEQSTSTTTGCAIFAGGVGVQKNINIGGNFRFAGGTVPATAASSGTTGDIRYDGSHLYICTATNTWVRTALSTW